MVALVVLLVLAPVAVPEVTVPDFVTIPVPVDVVLMVAVVMVEFEVADEPTTEIEELEESVTWAEVVLTLAGTEAGTVTTAGWVVTGRGCDVAGVVTGRG